MTHRAKPQVVARRSAARTRVFHIEEVDLLFSNGATRTYERILGSDRGAVLVAPVDDQNLHLVREYATGMDRYEVTFIKGNVDPDEDMLEAANRELQEEIGLGAHHLEHVLSMTTAPGYLRHSTHMVLARDLYASPRDGDEPEPLQHVTWPLAALDDLLKHEEFTDSRSVAALFLLQRRLAAR